jgi:hypothetical protein
MEGFTKHDCGFEASERLVLLHFGQLPQTQNSRLIFNIEI